MVLSDFISHADRPGGGPKDKPASKSASKVQGDPFAEEDKSEAYEKRAGQADSKVSRLTGRSQPTTRDSSGAAPSTRPLSDKGNRDPAAKLRASTTGASGNDASAKEGADG